MSAAKAVTDPFQSCPMSPKSSIWRKDDWQKAVIRRITNPCAHMYGEDLHTLDIFHTLYWPLHKAPSSKGNSLVLIPQQSNWKAALILHAPFLAGMVLCLTGLPSKGQLSQSEICLHKSQTQPWGGGCFIVENSQRCCL